MWLQRAFLLTLLLAASSRAAKLLVLPNQSLSHTRYFAQVSKPLVERGHEVSAPMNGACVKSVRALEAAGVKVLPYFTEDQSCYTENDEQFARDLFTEKGELRDPADALSKQCSQFLADAEALFGNKTLFAELEASDFDLCLLDGFLLTLNNYIVPYKLGIPYVSLTTSFIPYVAGVPALPSFSPTQLGVSSDKMTFIERVKGVVEMFAMPKVIYSWTTNQDSLVDRYATEKPPVSLFSLQRGSSLWLVNTDPVLDYPRVSLPHVVNIGGLSTVPPKPLPQDLQDLMDRAAGGGGAVVLSFGSIAKNLPGEIIVKILRSFEHFPEVTLVMKYNGPELETVPPNVHLLKWLPQNDLLAQPAVRLFITHSGNNGQFEALFHSVPMIGLPLFGDQGYNANRMQVKGFGIAMKTFSFTVEEMVANIRTILTDDSYKKAISHASAVYKSQFQTARERATYWIEHVLTFGSSHLVSHSTQLPWYQFWLVDVFVFLLCVTVVTITIVLYLLFFCYRSMTSGRTKEKRT